MPDADRLLALVRNPSRSVRIRTVPVLPSMSVTGWEPVVRSRDCTPERSCTRATLRREAVRAWGPLVRAS
jgi:hypothetical protein